MRIFNHSARAKSGKNHRKPTSLTEVYSLPPLALQPVTINQCHQRGVLPLGSECGQHPVDIAEMLLRATLPKELQLADDDGSGSGMEEYLFHFIPNLIFAPIWMLEPNRNGFEFSGGPVKGKGGPQFLLARHPAKDGKIFGRQGGIHVLMLRSLPPGGKRESAGRSALGA